MNNFTKITPVSDLPKKYSELIKEANRSDEPIVLFKRNKPVGAVVNFKFLNTLLDAKKELELREALDVIKEGEDSFDSKKTKTLEKPSDLWRSWKKKK